MIFPFPTEWKFINFMFQSPPTRNDWLVDFGAPYFQTNTVDLPSSGSKSDMEDNS
jgi:hypothetical protein